MQKTVVTLTGPSCSGKSTLARQLVETEGFVEIVSTTTRPKRAGEIEGEHYYFVAQNEFNNIEMLEAVGYGGHNYGASVKEVDRKMEDGKIAVIVVEPNGMIQINAKCKALGWRHIPIFVNCSLELQNERILRRFIKDYEDNEDKEKIIELYVARLSNIRDIESAWQHIGRNFWTYHVEEFSEKTDKAVLIRLLEFIQQTTA